LLACQVDMGKWFCGDGFICNDRLSWGSSKVKS